MNPNEHWTDFAIGKQFEKIDEFIAVTATLPNQIVKLGGDVDRHIAELRGSVEANTQRLGSHHEWIEDLQERNERRYVEIRREVADEIKKVTDLCERIGQELRDDARERFRGRISLMVAIISAAAIVAAAIITSQ